MDEKEKRNPHLQDEKKENESVRTRPYKYGIQILKLNDLARLNEG